jgi:hypothetical protein
MAKIPTYNNLQVGIGDISGRQQSVASAELMGMQDARQQAGLGKGLELAARAGMEIQEKQDTAIVLNKKSEFLTRLTDYELQAKQRKGLNAAPLPTESDDFYDKQVEEITKDLSDRQKAAFQAVALQQRPSFRNSIYAHSANEINKAQEDGFRNSIDTMATRAAANPDIAAQMREETIRTVDAWNQIKGADAATKERARTIELTNLHANVIASMGEKDIDAATGYFFTHKKEMDGKTALKIEADLTKVGMEKKVQTEADNIVAMKLSDVDALRYIEANYSGAVEKELKQEYKMRSADNYAAKQRSQVEAGDQAWDVYNKTGSISKIPMAIRDAMDPKQLSALKAKAMADAEAKLGKGDGYAKNSDIKLYTELRQQAMDDPKGFASINLLQHATKLNKANYEGLLDIQSSIKKGDTGKLAEVRSLDTQISASVSSLNFDAEKKSVFKDRVSAEIDNIQQSTGKKLDADGRQKVIDKYLIEGEVESGSFFKPDKNKRYYEVAGTPDAGMFSVSEIPKAERQKIEASLTRNGKKVTDAEVARLYKLKMGL